MTKNNLETNSIVVNIRELYTKEPLNSTLAMACSQLGIVPQGFENEGITVSVKVPYTLWCSKDEVLLKNKEAYESIDAHRHLFTFATAYGVSSLEELSENPYSNWFLWIKIKDRRSCGENRLILTHGHAPDRQEAYYRAKDYDDFWNVVERLTEMYDNANQKYEPIILEQTNGMCGSAHKKWQLQVNN